MFSDFITFAYILSVWSLKIIYCMDNTRSLTPKISCSNPLKAYNFKNFQPHLQDSTLYHHHKYPSDNNAYETFTVSIKNHFARSLRVYADFVWAASEEHCYVIFVLYLWNTVTQEEKHEWDMITDNLNKFVSNYFLGVSSYLTYQSRSWCLSIPRCTPSRLLYRTGSVRTYRPVGGRTWCR